MRKEGKWAKQIFARRTWRTTMNQKNRESVIQKFEFRNIRPEETDQAVMIEQICFVSVTIASN